MRMTVSKTPDELIEIIRDLVMSSEPENNTTEELLKKYKDLYRYVNLYSKQSIKMLSDEDKV
jgi:hypothetical protein